MNIIVIGAGEVGYHLAKELSNRDHDVIVVDVSRERLERIEEQLDVTTLCGNGAHVDVLHRAEVEELFPDGYRPGACRVAGLPFFG